MAQDCKVVALAGISGCGKSALAARLVALLGDATSLSFDAYQESTVYPPESWSQAIDPSRIASPIFFRDLQALRRGESIVDPQGRRCDPACLLILDWNFGQAHRAVAAWIDYCIYLDTPPDIAMVRRLLRHLQVDLQPYRPEERLQIIEHNLTMYLGGFGEACRQLYAMVAQKADLVVDANRPLDTLARELAETIHGLP